MRPLDGIGSSFATGLQMGGAIGGALDQHRARVLQRTQMKRTEGFKNALGSITPDQGIEAYNNLFNQYPEFTQQIEQFTGRIEAQQRKGYANTLAKAEAAMTNGNKDRAKEILSGTVEGLKRTNPEAADMFESLYNSVDKEDGKFKQVARVVGAHLGGDDYLKQVKGFADVAETEAKTQGLLSDVGVETKRIEMRQKELEVSKQNANTAEEKNEIQRELNKINAELKVEESKKKNPTILKAMADLDASANESATMATKADDLLKQIDEVARSTGVMAKTEEWFKSLMGTEDEKSKFRTDLIGLLNNLVIGQRKPGSGPMTDKDYSVLRAAYQSPDASDSMTMETLKAVKRYSLYASRADELKHAWMDEVGHTGKSRSDEPLNIGGYEVKKGENYRQFMKRLGDQVYMDAIAVPNLPSESTMQKTLYTLPSGRQVMATPEQIQQLESRLIK